MNGLNQLTATGSTSFSHDANGNVSAIGATAYGYTADNRLTSGPASSYGYDPVGRLFQQGATSSFFRHDGADLVSEQDWNSGATLHRYVYGADGEPLVWYEGSWTADRHWLHGDERGSVIAASDDSGALYGAINRYDEYGAIQGSLNGHIGYAGRPMLADAGLTDNLNRIYNATFGGRFMQPDRIGYGGGMNWYAYSGNDPVNFTDPLGLDPPEDPSRVHCVDLCVTVSGVLAGGFGSWFNGNRLSPDVICGRASAEISDPCFSLMYWSLLSGLFQRLEVFPYRSPFDRTIVDAMGEVQAAVRTVACTLLYYLPEGSRIRLGADAGGGHGDALTGGAGVSLHRDGSFNWDHYYGSGQGEGGILGIGLGWDMNAHQATGWSHTNGEYGIAAGYRAGGGNFSYSRSGGVGVGGGVSAGPRFGLLLTHVNTNTYTRQLSAPVCPRNN